MRKIENIVIALFSQAVLSAAIWKAQAQVEKTSYPAMAPLNQYLMQDKHSEIALARSAAPKSVSDRAEIMVLGPQGYTTVVKGTNGFLCVVERGWGAATDAPDFWNPKVRAPICFNQAAATSFAQIYLMKTRLVLAGKSKADILQTTTSALDKKELRPLEPGAMCYMLSKHQYLNDQGKSWHPHLMFLAAGNVEKSWGANLPGSPVIAANDPEERATIFMVWVAKWSDGTPAPLH
jgi:hypothetical protein